MSTFQGPQRNLLNLKAFSHNDNIKASLEMVNDSQGNVKESSFDRY